MDPPRKGNQTRSPEKIGSMQRQGGIEGKAEGGGEEKGSGKEYMRKQDCRDGARAKRESKEKDTFD